jgi:hypothetical protein
MGIKVIPRSVAVLSTGGSQLSVDIDHTEDSFTLGDGTRTMELQDVGGGIWAIPVKPLGGGDASAANQTSGDQKTQIVDAGGVVAEIDDVGGEKAMKVSVIASVGAAGGASATDESAFTAGTSLGAPIMGQYDANDSAVIADGLIGILGMTTERWLKVAVQNNISGFSTAAHQVTQNGYLDGLEGLLTTIDTDTGNIATSVANIDTDCTTIIGHLDGVEGLLTTIDADTGSILLAVDGIEASVDGIEGLLTTIDADTGNLAGILTNTADIETLLTTHSGYLDGIEGLLTTIDADTGAIMTAVQIIDNAISGNEMQVDVITMPTTTVVGGVAHGTASSGNPNQIGLHARNSNPTAVDNGDVVFALADLAGRQVVTKSDRALVVSFVGDIATTTEETMLAAGAAGVFHDLTQLTLTNAHATDAAVVFLRDATAGSTVWQHSIPAQSGIVVTFDPPMNQTTAANNWTIDMAVSTATIYYTGVAMKRIA